MLQGWHEPDPQGGGTLSSCLPASVSVLVCFRFVLNLRSRSDLWFSSVCGVCVCLCVVCMHVCLGTVQFLHLSLQPTRPTHYAMRDFYRHVSGSCDIPHGGLFEPPYLGGGGCSAPVTKPW